MAMTAEMGGPARPGKGPAFWAILAILAIYVGSCTRQRDNYPSTDDWEHHRAILALSKDLWKPGNPTFATDEPSIRYSPYSLALALIVRAGGDAFYVLGWAGVANTVLMGLGLRSFLAAYRRADLAPAALIVMVSLWGVAPGYANSYALADLPVHQVNPSAFVWALTLFMWSWLRRLADSGLRASVLVGIALLGSLSMLSHAMTGAAAVVGLGVVALVAPRGRRVMLLAASAVVGMAILAACSAWPWYNFLEAIRGSEDDWYNSTILWYMLTIWSVPAILLSASALPLLGLELVQVGCLGAVAFYALSASSLATKSALTARFPMIGIFFLHAMVATYLVDSDFFRPGSWPGRIRGLFAPDYARSARPILDIVAGLVLAYCLAGQLWSILREPGLGRAYVAPLLKFEDKQDRLKPRYDRLLAGVGERDVVLADITTSWPVPSSRGRIVGALHYEFFTKGQQKRWDDVEEFFRAGTPDEQRLATLKRYDARWILLSRKNLAPDAHAQLLRPKAVVGSDKDLTLMDAKLWEEAR